MYSNQYTPFPKGRVKWYFYFSPIYVIIFRNDPEPRPQNPFLRNSCFAHVVPLAFHGFRNHTHPIKYKNRSIKLRIEFYIESEAAYASFDTG